MKKIASFLAAFGFALAVSLISASPAHAEVWGYVDAKGIAHFAAEKVDERYELYFRGGESFDTANGLRTPRPVAVPTAAASKLIAYFEISPGYKQVAHHLRAASKANDIDVELLKALVATESGFDAGAVSPSSQDLCLDGVLLTGTDGPALCPAAPEEQEVSHELLRSSAGCRCPLAATGRPGRRRADR